MEDPTVQPPEQSVIGEEQHDVEPTQGEMWVLR